MADLEVGHIAAAHAVSWAAAQVMPTIEELVARGGEVAQGEARPRTAPPPLARATNELVLRCYEAAEQFVAANKVTVA